MDEKKGIIKRVFQFLSDLAGSIDDWLRFGDFKWNLMGRGSGRGK